MNSSAKPSAGRSRISAQVRRTAMTTLVQVVITAGVNGLVALAVWWLRSL